MIEMALYETTAGAYAYPLTTDARADGIQHRRRLAEPEPALSSLSQREQRAILREKMGLPPSYDPRRWALNRSVQQTGRLSVIDGSVATRTPKIWVLEFTNRVRLAGRTHLKNSRPACLPWRKSRPCWVRPGNLSWTSCPPLSVKVSRPKKVDSLVDGLGTSAMAPSISGRPSWAGATLPRWAISRTRRWASRGWLAGLQIPSGLSRVARWATRRAGWIAVGGGLSPPPSGRPRWERWVLASFLASDLQILCA